MVLWIKVTPQKAARRHCATIKRLNKHGKSLSSIGASGGVALPWLGVNLSLGSEAGTPQLMGYYCEIQRKSPGSKFPASLTSLDAPGCFNVTGDILLVCYFKPWISVECWSNSWFRVENLTCHCTKSCIVLYVHLWWSGLGLLVFFLSNSLCGFLPQRPNCDCFWNI